MVDALCRWQKTRRLKRKAGGIQVRHRFTMAEAAREAGVSVAAPYRHFKDRDALLAAASVETFGVLRGCWMKPCPPSWSSRQKRSCCS